MVMKCNMFPHHRSKKESESLLDLKVNHKWHESTIFYKHYCNTFTILEEIKLFFNFVELLKNDSLLFVSKF
jgi:hypothetical protein